MTYEEWLNQAAGSGDDMLRKSAQAALEKVSDAGRPVDVSLSQAADLVRTARTASTPWQRQQAASMIKRARITADQRPINAETKAAGIALCKAVAEDPTRAGWQRERARAFLDALEELER